MARTLLTGETASQAQIFAQPKAVQASGLKVERLRRARSQCYLDAIGQLDSGGKIVSDDALAGIRDAVAAEFPDGPASWPIGWVAKCYLGVPYEVHMLDLSGQIARHFKCGEAMPGGLDRARSLAAGGQYALIEVYTDKMVAIAADGATAVSQL